MTVIEAGYSGDAQQQAPQGLQQSNWPWVSPQVTPEHIERWVSTTPLLPLEYFLDSTIDIRPDVTASVATRLVLMLQIHRVEHGEFPEHLHDLEGEVPRDPLTGGDFGYAPEGFDAPAVVLAGDGYRAGFHEQFFVPAGAPLVWSPGSTRPEPKLDGELIMLHAAHFADHSRYVELKDAADRLFADRQPATAHAQRRILFVYVGQRPW
jgi:hypothetical protein